MIIIVLGKKPLPTSCRWNVFFSLFVCCCSQFMWYLAEIHLANRASPARVIRSLLSNNIVITIHFYIASMPRTILSLPSISTLHQCNAAMLMWVAKLPYSLDYQNAGYFLYSPYFPEFAPFASEQNFPSLALLPSASRSLATEQSYHVRHICNLRKLASRPSFPSLLGAPSMLQIWKKMFVNKSWVTSTKVLIK